MAEDAGGGGDARKARIPIAPDAVPEDVPREAEPVPKSGMVPPERAAEAQHLPHPAESSHLEELVDSRGGELVVDSERMLRLADAEALQAPIWQRYTFDRRDVIYGNDVELLRDGSQAFPAMIEAIDAAERAVCLETYILEDDAVGRIFADALLRAAARHVRVSLLYDAVGSPLLPPQFIDRLKAGKVSVAAFRPLSARLPFRVLAKRDHRKVLVVDDQVAFVGGINIHAQAASVEDGGQGWHDFAVRVRGPAVMPLGQLFDESWRLATRKRLRRRQRRDLVAQRPVVPPAGEVAAQVVATDNVRGRWSIRRSLIYAITRAQSSVLIANAYFVPDAGVIRAITMAAQRGVAVHVIVPDHSDVPVVDWVRGYFYDKLLAAGVRIHHWTQGVLHAKVAVVDDAWAMVGSYNLDWMSLLRLHEVVVAVLDSAFAARLAAILRVDIAASREIMPALWEKRSLWRRLGERFLYLFRRYL